MAIKITCNSLRKCLAAPAVSGYSCHSINLRHFETDCFIHLEGIRLKIVFMSHVMRRSSDETDNLAPKIICNYRIKTLSSSLLCTLTDCAWFWSPGWRIVVWGSLFFLIRYLTFVKALMSFNGVLLFVFLFSAHSLHDNSVCEVRKLTFSSNRSDHKAVGFLRG